MSQSKGWIGVDLDGTLAHYEGWVDVSHIGEPISAMVQRVHTWVGEFNAGRGPAVKIFTARVAGRDSALATQVIREWCLENLGYMLPVTNIKDFGMIELWDDRAVTVELNTGKVIMSPKGRPTP